MEVRRFIPFRRTSFATVVDCMDGRTKRPVEKITRRNTKATVVDTITDAGIVAGLAAGDSEVIERVRSRVAISVDKHNSKGITVGGHAKCAGNPVDRETHIRHVREAVDEIKAWGYGVPVRGVYTEPRKTLFKKRESTRRQWVARIVA